MAYYMVGGFVLTYAVLMFAALRVVETPGPGEPIPPITRSERAVYLVAVVLAVAWMLTTGRLALTQ